MRRLKMDVIQSKKDFILKQFISKKNSSPKICASPAYPVNFWEYIHLDVIIKWVRSRNMDDKMITKIKDTASFCPVR